MSSNGATGSLMGELGASSESHRFCTGLVVSHVYKRAPRSLVPGDSWSQGTRGSRSASSSRVRSCRSCPERGDTSRAATLHPTPPGPCPCPGTPCFLPFPVREEGQGRIHTEKAGPPQPHPSSLENKRKPLSSPRPESVCGASSGAFFFIFIGV